jgi:hypothetical protein
MEERETEAFAQTTIFIRPTRSGSLSLRGTSEERVRERSGRASCTAVLRGKAPPLPGPLLRFTEGRETGAGGEFLATAGHFLRTSGAGLAAADVFLAADRVGIVTASAIIVTDHARLAAAGRIIVTDCVRLVNAGVRSVTASRITVTDRLPLVNAEEIIVTASAFLAADRLRLRGNRPGPSRFVAKFTIQPARTRAAEAGPG